MQHAPLIALNACSTAVAALLGTSLLFPRETHYDGQHIDIVDAPRQILGNVMILTILTTILGCYSTLSVRWSYTCWYQVWCFLFAMVCINGRAINAVYLSIPKQRMDGGLTYEPVERVRSPAQNDHQVPSFIDETGINTSEILNASPRPTRTSIYLARLTLAMFWIPYLYLNFRHDAILQDAMLDRQYVAILPIEVVISMYNEPTGDIARLIRNLRDIPQLTATHVTIYVKTKADDVVMLPNIGREGETYLNHVLTRWYTLATETIFLQARIHNPREVYARLNRFYQPYRTGFLSLGWSGVVCNIEDCGDEFFWQDETHIFPKSQARINSSNTQSNALLNYKGQFIVSAARIRGIDKSIYDDLGEALVDGESWAHQEPYLRGRKDSTSQPLFGYTMESMWNMLFQCSDMQVAWKCPSLISGWRPGGSVEDCQCFDL